MSLNESQQLQKLIADSKNILLAFSVEKTDDSIAAALALKTFLEKQNKIVTVAGENYEPSRHLRFLNGVELIRSHLDNLQKMIIKVDISKAKLESVSYEIKDSFLNIYLSPKQGIVTKEDLRTAHTSYKYDLIVTFGARDLHSLGKIFLHNTDIFYKTPIINFDNHVDNEFFGQVNLIDSSLASICELILKTIEHLDREILDKEIATILLTGMTSQTRSFKSPNVTPHTLNTAGKLMNLGAEREKIIQHLYRTKSISMLKLWGSALSNLQNDRGLGLVWTTITREDFIRSGAREDDLKGVVTELIANSPEAKMILILNEKDHDEKGQIIHGLLSVDSQFNAPELVELFHPTGNKKMASFEIEGKNLKEAEELVLTEIRGK